MFCNFSITTERGHVTFWNVQGQMFTISLFCCNTKMVIVITINYGVPLHVEKRYWCCNIRATSPMFKWSNFWNWLFLLNTTWTLKGINAKYFGILATLFQRSRKKNGVHMEQTTGSKNAYSGTHIRVDRINSSSNFQRDSHLPLPSFSRSNFWKFSVLTLLVHNDLT